jgi:hypothetical protein
MKLLRGRIQVVLAVWAVAALSVGLSPTGLPGSSGAGRHRTMAAGDPAIPGSDSAVLQSQAEAESLIPAPASGADRHAGPAASWRSPLDLARSGGSWMLARPPLPGIEPGGRLRPRSPPEG